ncbi:hypothetical protein PHISCL_06887 [Aspergillus sclerotialis]|uniref:Uncharacterized protein n=1 Tax=Aspergillus sclerotialis TaxID=2070753 RepID=A0A3A2ZCC2_9EURO|nr:hypothetical protein PHISCL_06887 [Aspergillus sclerotialis]
MPETISPSFKRQSKSAKNNNLHSSSPHSNVMQHIDSTTASRSPKNSNKAASLGSLNGDRKRRGSSVSSVSSVSSIELSDDENDSDEDADDEEEPSASHSPSYGRRREKAHKAGRKSKKMRLSGVDYNEKNGDENDSDGSLDDDYAAVDYITDDDNEEQDVEKLEELLIMESEDENRAGGMILASDGEDTNQWTAGDAFDDHMLLSGASFFDDEQLYGAMDAFGEAGLASEPVVETPMPRHVHFEEEHESSSDSDSHTEDEIPSDFLHQDSLDPQLRRMIENENDTTRNRRQQSDETFGDADYGHGNIYHAESDAVSGGESSGYETDDGETTDEDLPPPATITHPRSILRRDSSASLPPMGDDQVESPIRRRGPIMGTFVADPHKPVALVDCTGKHLVIIPAYSSSRHDWLESASNSISGTANNSPRATTMQLVDESDTDALASPNRADFSPMLASSANLMMTALGNDITPGGQVMGPPEAFYPSRDFTIDSSFEDDDDDDPEEALNVEDFIDFGNGSSDEEIEEKGFESDALVSPIAPSSVPIAEGTPTPSRTADPQQGSSAERFLNHLDQGIVTAFRRNHNRYQALLRLPHHREFMPANSPSRPASVFRHARHADQRTPTRKRKANGYAGGEAVRRKLMDAHRRSQLPF